MSLLLSLLIIVIIGQFILILKLTTNIGSSVLKFVMIMFVRRKQHMQVWYNLNLKTIHLNIKASYLQLNYKYVVSIPII